MDNQSKPRVHWGPSQELSLSAIDRVAHIRSMHRGIEDVNLQKLIELMKNIVNENDVVNFFTCKDRAQLRVLFAGFACKSEESRGYYDSQKENFNTLLLLLFKTIGTNDIVTAFIELQTSFINCGDSGFLPDILEDFNSIANEYKIQHGRQHLDIYPTAAFIDPSGNQHLDVRYILVDFTPQQKEIIESAKHFIAKTVMTDLNAITKNLESYSIHDIGAINADYNLALESIIPEFNFTAASFNHEEQIIEEALSFFALPLIFIMTR